MNEDGHMARFMTLMHLARTRAPGIMVLATAVLWLAAMSVAATGGGDFPRWT
jgi:hypothetical protein